MKTPLLYIAILFCCLATKPLKAQSESYAGTDASAFDFWIGNWYATWADTGHGTNQITRELNAQIIQENFSDLTSGYFGKSWTVYNKTKKIWQQTWVDSKGTYLAFTGGVVDSTRELQLKQTTKAGQKEMLKMVFYNIQPNSFDWEWKKSTDEGKTWQVLWKIRYDRQL